MSSHFPALSKRDAVQFAEILNEYLVCDSFETYRGIFSRLNCLIPFDYATSGLVKLNDEFVVESYDLANINFTDQWIQSYNEQKIYLVDVTVAENFKNFKTQCWKDTYKKYDTSKKLLHFAADFNLLNGYSCGVKSLGAYNKSSMISFVWNFKTKSKLLTGLINYIAPYIHIAMSNSFYASSRMMGGQVITRREREILSWLKDGKTSWDISRILNISEVTVNFHISNIINKLDSTNRVQAVAIALRQGIIDFD